MNEFSHLAFAMMALIVVITPGPTVLLALSNGSRFGIGQAGYGILGAAVSDGVLITCAGLGLGTLLATSALWFNVVKWTGVAYLVWLGIQMVRSTKKPGITARETRSPRLGTQCKKLTLFKKSLFTAVTNPKGYLFFAAFLPQFLDVSEPLLPQYVTLAFTFIVLDVIVMAFYAELGVRATRFLRDTGTLWVNRTCGSLLLSMASVLAFLRRSEF